MRRYLLLLALTTLACTLPNHAALIAVLPTLTPTATLPASPTPIIIPTATPNPTPTAAPPFDEPEGCLLPPNDYNDYAHEIIDYGSYDVELNRRTLAMLDHAQTLYDQWRGGPIIFRERITQGSYNTSVEASFGTHAGGGAVDISVLSIYRYEVLEDEIPHMIRALRVAGFAAYFRDASDNYGAWPPHIHAIAIGDAELSEAASLQLDGPAGYFRGFDGLPREGEPRPDRHGGPVLCAWMLELGYRDLR